MRNTMFTHLFLWVLIMGSLGLAGPAWAQATAGDAPQKNIEELWRQAAAKTGAGLGQEAAVIARQIYDQAKASHDPGNQGRALLELARIKLGMYETEQALDLLYTLDFPDDPIWQGLLHMYRAGALRRYYQLYRYDILQRTAKPGVKDFREWTSRDLWRACQADFVAAWKVRETLGHEQLSVFSGVIEAGTYPVPVRPTLRDFLANAWAEFLADQETWLPEESEQLRQLGWLKLFSNTHAHNLDPLVDKPLHPLERVAGIYADLEQWHAGRSETEAALDSACQRIVKLHAALPEKKNQALAAEQLTRLLDKSQAWPWWAYVQYQLALIRETQGDRVAAVQAAKAGYKNYPQSMGGKLCLALEQRLTAPEYHLSCELQNPTGLGKVKLEYRNLAKLQVRAYLLPKPVPGHLQLYWTQEEVRQILIQDRPVLEKEISLQDPGTFQEQTTGFEIDLPKPGWYLLVGSGREDFSWEHNKIEYAPYLATEIGLLIQEDRQAQAQVYCLRMRDGKPAQAQIRVYREHWSAGARRYEFLLAAEGQTDQQGVYTLSSRLDENLQVVGISGDSVCLKPSGVYLDQADERARRHVFIYTDRAIYRPEQTVQFKALAVYADQPNARYKVLPQFPLEVQLLDPNREVVQTLKLSTNAWGSASGVFVLPKGRLLGAYSVQLKDSQLQRQGGFFQVEEYKVPKFEVKLDGPASALRLDQPAKIMGQARYYFGGAVRQGKVSYEIIRLPFFSWWYEWLHPLRGRQASETIARGTAETGEDGVFSLAFTPAGLRSFAQEREVTYLFQVKVSVTDEGGDTISTEAGYRAGLASLKAEIQVPEGFPEAHEKFSLVVRLRDLDDKPRSGSGTLAVYAVPAQTMPLPPAKEMAEQLVIRGIQAELASLVPGTCLSRQELKQGALGEAKSTEMELPAGVYILEFTTLDAFGQVVTAKQFLQVAPKPGQTAVFPLSLSLASRHDKVLAGQEACFLISSGIPQQTVYFELLQDGRVFHRQLFSGLPAQQIRFPVTGNLRGGFVAKLFCVRDYRLFEQTLAIQVPWENKEFKLETVHLRKVLSPGSQETITLKISQPQAKPASAEVLATLYDRALDYYAKLVYPELNLVFKQDNPIPSQWGNQVQGASDLGLIWYVLPSAPLPEEPRFAGFQYSGRRPGMGLAKRGFPEDMLARTAPGPAGVVVRAASVASPALAPQPNRGDEHKQQPEKPMTAAGEPAVSWRKNFIETAFFKPQLVTDDKGEVSIHFDVPDSVTSWNLLVMAHDRELAGGSIRETVETKKEFMLRPYLPRFLREQDEVVVRAVVENAGTKDLQGMAYLRIEDEIGRVLTGQFQVEPRAMAWTIAAGKSAVVSFRLKVPAGLGKCKLQIFASSQSVTDGEERWLAILPSRLHLQESRFVVLKHSEEKVITLPDLKNSGADPSLRQEALVITAEGQLIYSLLKALPYLYLYPYECVEQTLNRFVCASQLQGVFGRYPVLAKASQAFSKRTTPFEPWDAYPGSKLDLEETPWLVDARGGTVDQRYQRLLDPKKAATQAQDSLARLQKCQKSSGGFPWFSGGPEDFYMTLYVLEGLANAAQAGVRVPRAMTAKALAYCLKRYGEMQGRADQTKTSSEADSHLNLMLVYVLSNYVGSEWQDVLKPFKRAECLASAMKIWQQLSPYGRALLALSLHRANQPEDARKVLNSILDMAKTTETEGTYWLPEPKAWLWYQDTVESHAFILKTLLEIAPDDPHLDGIALWLLRNKQGNQWKSTKATAAAISALAAYMHKTVELDRPGQVEITVLPQQSRLLEWKPGEQPGRLSWTLGPDEIKPESGVITLRQRGQGFAFASAVWQYSTEKIPAQGDADVLSVERKYFRVETAGRGQRLLALEKDSELALGGEVEVELTLRAKVPMEYVHLSDPRAAGYEPEDKLSGYHWDQALGYYEEIRDSGTHFFFGGLPQGTFTFRYRLRATTAGVFQAGPATLQSLYAPEFSAYSAGQKFVIKP